MMMRAVPPICASFQLPFPQQPSFQDANRKKQNVSVVVSLSCAQFAMHVCLLCLTLALSFFCQVPCYQRQQAPQIEAK